MAYACVLGHEWGPSEQRGVFKTTDGGKNWQKVLYRDTQTGCSDIDVNPSNSNEIYAGMYTYLRQAWHLESGGRETALYKSMDGGATWKKLTNGIPAILDRIGVAVADSNPDVVYMISETPNYEGELWRSDDAGASLHSVQNDAAFWPSRVVRIGAVHADEGVLSIQVGVRIVEVVVQATVVQPLVAPNREAGDHLPAIDHALRARELHAVIGVFEAIGVRDDTVRQAQDLEKQGRWFEACCLYDELLSKDRNHAELREAYRRSLRHFRQERRLQDQPLQSVLSKMVGCKDTEHIEPIAKAAHRRRGRGQTPHLEVSRSVAEPV